MPVYRGSLQGKGRSFAIVVARFNEFITRRLLESACETLDQAGVPSRAIKIFWVPGALEMADLSDQIRKGTRSSFS